MRRALLTFAAICACIASALALTPGQITTLFGGGVLPAVSSNFLAGVLDPANYTYSGASLRTITDATGAITYAPNNLLTYSNDFSNAAWSASLGASVSGSVLSFGAGVGANGALTHNVNITGTTAIFAVVLSGSGTVHIDQFGGSGSNQVTLTSTPTLYCVKISNSVIGVRIISAPGDTATDVTLRNASVSAVTYETSPRPGDQVITQAAAYYGPAFDNDPVSHAPLGFRVEEARTNLTAYSQDFTNAAWTPNDGASKPIVSGTTVSPDGTSNAQLWTAITGASVFQMLYQAHTVSSGQTVTGTAFFKAGTQRYFRIAIDNADAFGNAIGVVFDATLASATTSTVGVGTGATYSITAYPNSWYRVSLSGSITGKTNANMSVGFAGSSSGYFTTYSPSGQTGYVWGAQLEAGSFPTSYIPTAASPVSRAADVVQIVGPALRALQGVQGAAVVETGALSGSNGRIIGDLATTHAIIYQASSTTTGTTGLGPTISPVFGNAGTWATTQRSGITWSGSGTAMAGSGGVVNTSATPLSAAGLSLYLGNSNGVGFINGYVRKDAFYNRAPTAPQLQARTVLGAPF